MKNKYILISLMCDLISITFSFIWIINNVYNVGTMTISFMPVLFAIYFLYLSVTYKEPEKPKDQALIFTSSNDEQRFISIFPFNKITYARLEQNETSSSIKIYTNDGENINNIFHNVHHIEDTTMLFDMIKNHFNKGDKNEN